MNNVVIDYQTNSVWIDGMLVGSFVYHTDTIVRVTDYRDDTGYVGTMSTSDMRNYFEGYESE
jgi:hypothetical protein